VFQVFPAPLWHQHGDRVADAAGRAGGALGADPRGGRLREPGRDDDGVRGAFRARWSWGAGDDSGAVVVWISGAVELCIGGAVELWMSGAVDDWLSGAVDDWLSGAVDRWSSG
jgi:hypothetical protein